MLSSSELMLASKSMKRFVKSGDCLSIGAFTMNRNPMALTYEVLMQRIKDLHVVMHSGS
jgi:acyl CoA:acetate/3-ketoacid CoA transferase alpha subunit